MTKSNGGDLQPKSKQGMSSIKLHRVLVNKARQVALSRGITMADYLADVSGSSIERDYARWILEQENILET